MHVHRRKEDADLQPLAGRRRGWNRRSGDEHAAVRWRQHGIGRRMDQPLGIAKEEEEETGEDQERDAERPAEPGAGQRRRDERATNERIPGGIDAHRRSLKSEA